MTEKMIIVNRRNGERKFVKPGEVFAVDKLDDWYNPIMENLSEAKWDFVDKHDNKEFIWWNPLDWIPKYYTAK